MTRTSSPAQVASLIASQPQSQHSTCSSQLLPYIAVISGSSSTTTIAGAGTSNSAISTACTSPTCLNGQNVINACILAFLFPCLHANSVLASLKREGSSIAQSLAARCVKLSTPTYITFLPWDESIVRTNVRTFRLIKTDALVVFAFFIKTKIAFTIRTTIVLQGKRNIATPTRANTSIFVFLRPSKCYLFARYAINVRTFDCSKNNSGNLLIATISEKQTDWAGNRGSRLGIWVYSARKLTRYDALSRHKDCLKSTRTLSTSSHESDTVISTTNLASTIDIDTVPTEMRLSVARSSTVDSALRTNKVIAGHGLAGVSEEGPFPGLPRSTGFQGYWRL